MESEHEQEPKPEPDRVWIIKVAWGGEYFSYVYSSRAKALADFTWMHKMPGLHHLEVIEPFPHYQLC